MNEKELERERKITEIENRAKSNSHRLDKCEKQLELLVELVGSIKELTAETKHIREALNETNTRLSKLENKDIAKWDKFIWLVVTVLTTGILGFIFGFLGLS